MKKRTYSTFFLKGLNHLVIPIICLLLFTTLTLQAQPPELWGMTREGGEYDAGTIFKTDADGTNHMIVKSFHKTWGTNLSRSELCETSNGKLYGMTTVGGTKDDGVIFEYNPTTDTYTKKLDFDGVSKGAKPYGSLIQASNGKLYGMTTYGGTSGYGVLFEYDPTKDTYTKKLDFDGTNKGSHPYGSLMQAGNGKLYGMPHNGGTSDDGVLFEYDPTTDTYTKKLDFDDTDKGSRPYGSLMQASNGKLYGMTRNGGSGGSKKRGVLFEYDLTTDNYTIKLNFDGTNKGQLPYGSLIQAHNGNLYGMTKYGGTSGSGVLFEYDYSTGTYTKKLDFKGASKGKYPDGSLMQADNGKLYGMTSLGGTKDEGVIFEYDPTTDTYTKKLDFDGNDTGSHPHGSLMQAANGKLYGMTASGGGGKSGVLFDYNPTTNSYTKKLDIGVSSHGENPVGSLMQAANGKLYGMTSDGGLFNDYGVLFEYDPRTGIFTKKLDFDGNNGADPQGSLIQADNGKLYGMTYGGGRHRGVLFEYDPSSGIYTKKIDFDGSNGDNPYGSLMQAANGKLYGMTNYGGTSGIGVLFEYNPKTEAYRKKIDFGGNNTEGSRPTGSLMQATNGKLYGMTWFLERLFEYDPATDTYDEKKVFSRYTGEFPYGSLIEAANGKLYGMTSSGGTNDNGVLFEYNPTKDNYTKKLDFDGTDKGREPYGSLMQAANGKLYGMTKYGGTSGRGVLFEYDPKADIYTKKLDFDGKNGANPIFGHLIEVCLSTPVPDKIALSDLTGECSVDSPTAPTATSSCGGPYSGTTDASFPITDQGTTTITWTYDDGNGNTATQTQDVIIEDITAPVATEGSLEGLTDECSVSEPAAPMATDNCAGMLTGTTDATFPITAQGTTTIIWIYDDGNGNTATQTQDVIITLDCDDTALGLADLTSGEQVLFPNPTADQFQIKGYYVDLQISLYDLSGSIVKQFDTPQETYDISELPKGIYTLVLKSKTEVFRSKILKE